MKSFERSSACGALRALALLSASAAALALGAPAAAQDQPAAEGDDVIIVTGSRIAKSTLETPLPTVTVGSDNIENLGLTNVGSALGALPTFAPSANPVGTQAGSFGAGQTFVDMFGLGTQRTLTLVNGRRYVSSNTASIFGPVDAGSQVDLNTIPSLLVDRIETIAVGGAPVYGSDAIAGTVNIILKDQFQGVKLEAQYGISEQGDAPEYRFSGLAGTSFGDGRGNILVAAEYTKSGGLLYTDRAVTAEGRFFVAPSDPDYPYSNQLITNRRIPIMSQYGIPLVDDFIPMFGGEVANGAGQALRFDAQGNLVPIDFGELSGSVVNSSGGDGFSLLPVQNLLTETERFVGNVRGDYELTDGIRLFGEFAYARSKGTELRAQPVYNSYLFEDAGDPSGNLVIPLSNPFLSPEARATIAASIAAYEDAAPGQDYFYLGRANSDIVSGRGSTTVELYRGVLGLDGEVTVGGRSLRWEVVGNYGESKTVGSSRELVQQNFLNALNGCPADAENSPIATISATCVPFNPFGQQNPQSVADYMTTIANPIAINKQWVVTADVSGGLFNIWGGNEVSFALGYEHRQEEANFDPGAFFYGLVDPNDPTAPRQQNGRSIPIDPVAGKYNTDEIFGELRIPLVSPSMDVPFINLLEVNGAARYVDNSLTGGDLTWTAGGRWKPIADLTIRGNFTRAIRAPAVTELFNPTSEIFSFADDPCDSRYLNDGPNPAVRQANCAVAGLAPNFTSNIVDASQHSSLSGNPNLQNEIADSWTLGAIYTPRFVPGLSLSVDWVSISLKDAILSIDGTQTMTACYDSTNYPNEPICDAIDRGPDGQVEYLRTGYRNAASYDFRGLISQLSYTRPTPFLGADSRVGLRLSYQYIDKLEQTIGVGDLTTLRGGVGYSKHKATGSLSYENGPFMAYTQVQYIGPAVVDPDASANTYDYPHYNGVAFVDLGLAVNVQDKFTLRFVTENLFNQKPPFPSPAGGGVVTYFKGVMGRYFKVSATTRF